MHDPYLSLRGEGLLHGVGDSLICCLSCHAVIYHGYAELGVCLYVYEYETALLEASNECKCVVGSCCLHQNTEQYFFGNSVF